MKNTSLPYGIKTIISVNCIAVIVTIFFWIFVLFKIFINPSSETTMDIASKASTFGFLISDLIWAVPLLIISIPGLIKLKFYGWTSAQLANILWIYSLTNLWVRDIYIGIITPGDILFLPFAIFSIWSAYCLWSNRDKFNIL